MVSNKLKVIELNYIFEGDVLKTDFVQGKNLLVTRKSNEAKF